MALNTSLQGRLRNTTLPYSQSLMPLFEAVVNSIHAIDEAKNLATGKIEIEIIRKIQNTLNVAMPQEEKFTPIYGFKIIDNGIGFTKNNMMSFETLDSEYKASQGCRGIGRLMWLKAFTNVSVYSEFIDEKHTPKLKTFLFNAKNGVYRLEEKNLAVLHENKTIITLEEFIDKYEKRAPKSCINIAESLLEHCLWYFVRENGAPNIFIKDQEDTINLNDLFEQHMYGAASTDSFKIGEVEFELLHIKLKSKTKQSCIAWCAAGRVVKEENITAGKIPGLHGRIQAKGEDFTYCCYLTSKFLDENVRPERIDFNLSNLNDEDLYATGITELKIREVTYSKISTYLNEYLNESKELGKKRVNDFVSKKAPRYRSILKYIPEPLFFVNPEISDKDLDLLLHKQLSEVENNVLAEGHEILNKTINNKNEYETEITKYMEKIDDIKKSDLAGYVCNRKVILDILEKAIQRGADGKYAREDLIHQLIMPMRKTSEEVLLEHCNLWLIDERLAFHDFLASDKTLNSMPITDNQENKEPDLCALNVYDEPLLVAEGKKLPLATLTIIEIKRPMRNDISSGEDKDPVEQVFGYLKRIRNGNTTTASGRPIPDSKDIPGFCYVICDLTSSMKERCRDVHDLTETEDKLGFFGYKKNINCYIEVISFDRLVNSAKERNRAFFDKLGLPAN